MLSQYRERERERERVWGVERLRGQEERGLQDQEVPVSPRDDHGRSSRLSALFQRGGCERENQSL